MKRCTKCGEEKALEEFCRRKNVRDGRASECKACAYQVTKAWLAKNPGHVAAWTRNRAETLQVPPDAVKACSLCGATKPVDEFHRQVSGRYGRESHCKACKAARYRERAEEISKRDRRRYAEDAEFRARKNEYGAAWNVANADRISTNGKRWREANPEKHRAAVEAWMEAHPERVRDSQRKRVARRRARKRDAFVEDVDHNLVYEMHGGRCGICGEFIDLTKGKFHVDHVMPLSKGGVHSYANTQPAHPRCNLRKFDRVDFSLTRVAA